jgi:hypothetical protein
MSDRLSEIRARLDKATPGPWMHGVQQGFHWVDTRPDLTVITIADDVPTDADAELIAHAPGDIRHLLSVVSGQAMVMRTLAAGWEAACAAVGIDPDASIGEWEAAFRALGVTS